MMLPPRPDWYMCGRQARVVRNAPSRWIASIFFHSAKPNASSRCTIWMPALLTRMSMPPNAATVSRDPGVHRVLARHVHRHTYAFAARRANLGGDPVGRGRVEIGDRNPGAFTRVCQRDLLPRPLAAPVTIADFPSSFMVDSRLGDDGNASVRWHFVARQDDRRDARTAR